jgi:hypothetical protein
VHVDAAEPEHVLGAALERANAHERAAAGTRLGLHGDQVGDLEADQGLNAG